MEISIEEEIRQIEQKIPETRRQIFENLTPGTCPVGPTFPNPLCHGLPRALLSAGSRKLHGDRLYAEDPRDGGRVRPAGPHGSW